jgi:hypothetical protein
MNRKIKSFKSYLNEVAPAIAAAPAVVAGVGARVALARLLPKIAGSAFRSIAIQSLLSSGEKPQQKPESETAIAKAELPQNLSNEAY